MSDVPDDKAKHEEEIKAWARERHNPEAEAATEKHIQEMLEIAGKIDIQKYHDEKEEFNPAELARDIVLNYYLKTDMVTDTLYFYDEERGVYDRNGDVRVRQIIENVLTEKNRQHRTTETVYLIHGKTLGQIEPSKKLTVENGVLDVVTGELTNPVPGEFIVNRLPVRYAKDAKCPKIIEFFSEVAPDDVRPQLEEIFGYCLLRELPIHKATVLLGEGANGKTTYTDLLSTFLGRENVCHVSLQQMCEGRFELAELYGRLANIVDDLPGTELKAVGNFKWVTGNSPIMAQRKHKDPFTFWNTAKMIFNCNRLPKPSEDTIAYFRRFNIIPFNRFFIGEKCDKDKLKKLTMPEELSGLLNLALEGLKRILKNGDYTGAKSIEENRQLYIKSSDSCTAFVEECLEESDEAKDYILKEEVYQAYVKYCKDNRLPHIEQKPPLAGALIRTLPNAKSTKERVQGYSKPVWQYLKWKTVPVVPVVPPSHILENFNEQSSSNKKEVGTEGTVGAVSLVCGHCKKWHTGACSFPGDPNCLAPTNPCAKTCKDFEQPDPKKNDGLVTVLDSNQGGVNHD